MPVVLKPMSEQDFEAYSKDSIERFADQLISLHGSERSQAAEQSRKTFQKSLPGGRETPNTHLLSILKNDQLIGYLHFEVRTSESGNFAFGWDLRVFPEHRGHGVEAMKRAKDLLQHLGCERLSLHVFAQNDRAVQLYQALGFGIDSYNMSLEL
jgi:RimJ/RimL family protein N-acetyltransferase